MARVLGGTDRLEELEQRKSLNRDHDVGEKLAHKDAPSMVSELPVFRFLHFLKLFNLSFLTFFSSFILF